jgi:hypothetical protein
VTRVGAVAAGVAAALAAWAASAALAHDRPARLGAMTASGGVRLESPQDGLAVLTASRMLPGDAVSGTVALANTGDAAGDLRLTRSAIRDALGAGGGRLSAALVVRVDDVTGGAALPVFAGALDQLDVLALGPLAPGERRAYRITATLPDRGLPAGPLSGDNALQGASMQVDWTWRAEALAAAITPAPTATPAPPVAPPPADVRAAASVLTLRIPWQRVLKTRGITVWGTCDRRCALSFNARVQTAPKARTARVRTVMRAGVFRLAGRRRTLQPGVERRIKLQLTPEALRRLHALMLARGRAAVLVEARVSSALGAATVRRRIVIVTAPRAERRRAARHAGRVSRGSAPRR